MNKVLMQIVVECAVFFETSDETHINPDTAVQQLEQIGWLLRQLSPAERAEMSDYIGSLAQKAAGVAGQERRQQCLQELAEALGLAGAPGE